MQVKKQQLEPDMKQWAGSKLGKKYIKIVIIELKIAMLNDASGEKTFPWK